IFSPYVVTMSQKHSLIQSTESVQLSMTGYSPPYEKRTSIYVNKVFLSYSYISAISAIATIGAYGARSIFDEV
ncbi:MAG: hypothetical protein AAF530_19125, partial [Pseudomonadota bacterium]